MAVDASNELGEALSRWQLDAAAVRERMYRAPTPRERERWHALWLALQGWSTARVATALGRDPHTVGSWLAGSRERLLKDTAPEEVVRWLHSLAPEEICGRPHMPNECPLARYLNARNGEPAPGASVGTDGYDVADERYPLPAWAQHFVVRVDHSPARWKRPATRGITAAEALLLLEGLCASRLDRLTAWIGS
jgi:Homeodomain-like domain